ncbi:MAG: chemotaxis response regulator protein-glutamate methylesterase [Planctomycetaceae bacterium]
MFFREPRPLSTLPPLRIVVVDDSALFRLLMRNVLQSIPGCTVVGVANDGREAIDQILALKPDLVTLDVQMPEMDGIQTLREMNRCGLHVTTIMVSRLTAAGAKTTTDALLEGAFDFLLKPAGNSPAENKSILSAALQEKIAAVREARQGIPVAVPEPPEPELVFESDLTPSRAAFQAIVIGTSTGGPEALRTVIPGLSKDLPVPVLVVQHMPSGYTARLAERLNELSAINVQEASDGDLLRPGTVLLAPGGRHLALVSKAGKVSIQLTDDPPEHGCRPAVDYTLRSAVDVFQGQLLTVILTGMGRDGTDGCCLVRDHGGQVFAQHADGCVVYGMPRSVITNDLANRVIKLNAMASVINRTV